jgi:hypothetical protein
MATTVALGLTVAAISVRISHLVVVRDETVPAKLR